MLKRFTAFSIIISAVILLFSCSKKSNGTDPNLNKVNFTAFLNGFNVVPTNSSMASGNVSATYDTVTNALVFLVSYTGFIPNQWHVHKAAAGANGSIEIDMGTVIGPPVLFNRILTQFQEIDLMNNLYYVDLHSTAYPGGEIRGQLIH